MTEDSTRRRKLSAIMFTDMVGYSALAQKNESLALDLLEEHRHILRERFSRHSGREVETAGDSFFVEFDSAVDAVRCATDIQKALHERNRAAPPEKSITLRIGIHLGDVVHMGAHVHGDGVNIAARLEPCADPGGICISEDVARQVRNQKEFTLENIGKPQLKNIQLPVNAYRLVLPWKAGSRPGAITGMSLPGKRTKFVIGALAFSVLALFVIYIMLRPSAGPNKRSSIAVLPFRNFSGNIDNEYFSDGITDDVITKLSALNVLDVVSLTSVMRYKNTPKSIPEVAAELDVSAILEGSVRREKNQVRVVAQLIDAKTDRHLWSKTYDLEFTQILDVQNEVAERIAAALEGQVSPEQRSRISHGATGDPEAYDLYLKGRYHWKKRLPDHLTKSVDYFTQAIEKDPTYARAYAGLADAYVIMGDFDMKPPGETYPRAKEAATKALFLDSLMAEAHTSLAYSLMHHDWDWTNARQHFIEAIRLDSTYAQAHSWYALYLATQGMFDEASAHANNAVRLEPFSAVIRTDAGLTHYLLREYGIAEEQCTKAIELDPMFFAAYMLTGSVYERLGKFHEAIMKFSELSSASRGHPLTVASLGHAYALAGDSTNAQMMLEILQERRNDEYVSPYWVSTVYAALGKRDLALKWLESAYDARDGLIVFAGVDPRLDTLHSEQRFAKLLEKMGLSIAVHKARS